MGRRGELIARQHLEDKGYEIIATNYRSKLGEMDIVARDGAATVFVEVRTKTSTRFGRPEESITPDKASRLLRLARHYLQTHHLSDHPSRIDLIAVSLNSTDYRLTGLRHLKNILGG